MKSLRERGESLFVRTEFAHRFCASAELDVTLMAFFDPRTRTFLESWVGRLDPHDNERGHNITKQVERRLATWAATMPKNGSEVIFSEHIQESVVWIAQDEFELGVGAPVGELLPIIASTKPESDDESHHRTMLQMGLSYVSQQLTQVLYDRSAWMGTIVESAMQVLSIHFIAATPDGKVLFDSLKRQGPDAESSDWVVREKILRLISDGSRSELKSALNSAVSPERKSSIASILVSPGTARIVAISPLQTKDKDLALILFESEHTDHAKLRERFFDAYNLTPSESLVSHDILSGRSIAEAAEANNLTQATVRSYMKQVFAKTGTHRQSGLLSLYFNSILPVSINLADTSDRSA